MASPLRQLLRSLGVILLLNALTKPLWLLLEQEVQDRVGHATWGTYAALLSLSFLLKPLVDLGMEKFAVTRIAAAPRRYPQLAGRAAVLMSLLTLGYLATLMLVAWLLGYGPAQLGLLLVVGGYHVVLVFRDLFRACFQAFQEFRLDGLASVLDKLLLMIAVGAMLATGTLRFERFILALLGSMFLTAAVFGVVLRLRHGPIRLGFDRRLARRLLRGGWPFALMFLLSATNERLNQLMLERLASPEENGIFAAAYRWVAALQMYLWTVLPVFYAKFARNRYAPLPQQQSLFNTGQAIVALPILFVCGFLVFHGDKLFFLFTHSTAEQLSAMALNLKLLAGVLLLNGLFNLYSTYLTATGREAAVNRLLVLAILLGAGLNLVFIPRYGAVAASLSMVLAFGLLSAGYVMLVSRQTGLQLPGRLLAKLGLAGGAYVAALWGLGEMGLVWWAATALAGCLLAGMSWALKLVDPKAAFH